MKTVGDEDFMWLCVMLVFVLCCLYVLYYYYFFYYFFYVMCCLYIFVWVLGHGKEKEGIVKIKNINGDN